MATQKTSNRPPKHREVQPLVQDIVDARKAQKLTQEQLADLAGLSRRTIVLMESGGDCTLSSLRRVTLALGLQMRATPLQRPTLEDMVRENEMLFAQMRASQNKGVSNA